MSLKWFTKWDKLVHNDKRNKPINLKIIYLTNINKHAMLESHPKPKFTQDRFISLKNKHPSTYQN